MRNPRTAIHVVLAAAIILAGVQGSPAQVKSVDRLQFPPLRQTTIPQPERIVLDNGMVVMLLEDHELPIIDVTARIHTGSRLDPADKIGLASLTGSVLRTGGTTSMSGDDLDEFLEGRAAFIETGIGETAGSASMGCLKADFAEVLEVFADVLRNPAFEEDKIEVAKTQMEAGIARQNDQAQEIAFREFGEIVYGAGSPYAWSPTYDTVASVSRDDLIAWHAEYFHPNRIILGISGDFDTGAATKLVKEVFGNWQAGPRFQKPDVPYNRSVPSQVFRVEKDDVVQSQIVMGHEGIEVSNPDYFAVEVMNQVLSGGFGSRLFSNVRSKKGLAYTVFGGVGSNWDYPGTFTLYTATKTGSTAAAIDALYEEARGMVTRPPTEEEVKKAKDGLLNSFVFEYDSTQEIIAKQLTYEYYGFPLDWLQRYDDGIRDVTVEQVRAAAEKYIHPDRFAILVVGPTEGLDRPLSAFGEVAMVDISIPEPSRAEVAESVESLTRGRELIALAVDAMGGAAAVDGIEHYAEEGSVVVRMPQGDMEVALSVLVDYPDRYRQDMVLPFGRVAVVITPDGGFMQTPQGNQPLPGSQREEAIRELQRDPINMLRERNREGFKANAVGGDTVDGTEVVKVAVELDGEIGTYGIDPSSGRILMVAFRGNAPMNPQPGNVVQTYSDFREVDGITYPFSMAGTFNGEPSVSRTVKSLSFNGPLDETAFARPSEEGAAGGR